MDIRNGFDPLIRSTRFNMVQALAALTIACSELVASRFDDNDSWK